MILFSSRPSYLKRFVYSNQNWPIKFLLIRTAQATELAEAEEKEHVANEAADLLYFALVACTKAGVTLADVEQVLGKLLS